MSGSLIAPLRRVARMDRQERWFRTASETRKGIERLRHAVASPRWERSSARRIISTPAPQAGGDLAFAVEQIDAGRWTLAHRALGSHFLSSGTAFPLGASEAAQVAARILGRFPQALPDAIASADRILDGRYDLLGYRNLRSGSPPRWHYDPVHARTAPAGFWASIPYLDPSSGDHKIIWELNRHQHWLRLGRAYQLSGDRRYYVEFVRQLESWLQANPPLEGVNWASMLEVAFRSLSWMWAIAFFARAALEHDDGSAWLVDLLVGLDRQLAHVEHNLSHYFSPNTHLTGEALALYVCGRSLPELAGSARRAEAGKSVLLREAGMQIRPDGGHAELSAHYHLYSTEFYLLALIVARRSGDPAAGAFEQAARSQAAYLRTLADDNGRLPLLGDDDGGRLFPICGREPADCRDTLAAAAVILDEPRLIVAGTPEEVFWLCGATHQVEGAAGTRAAWPSRALPACGYYVSRNAKGDHLVLDAGPHGYLNGGHAHADALAVVLTVEGRPLLIDPGTATYTMDPATRDLFRSTAMHNTAVVNGRPQSEPGGPFHWRTRADARPSLWRSGPDADYIEARHTAYAPVVHCRSVLAVHGVGWFIVDHFIGDRAAEATTFWHLHPNWSVTSSRDAHIELTHHDGGKQWLASSAGLRLCPHDSSLRSYAPVYGRIERAECLYWRTNGATPLSALTFIPSGWPGSGLEVTTVELAARPSDRHAAAFRIRSAAGEALLLASTEGETQAAEPQRRADPWGTSKFTTNARVALLLLTDTGSETVLVDTESIGRMPAAAQPYAGLKRA